jgi:hypothetical protein
VVDSSAIYASPRGSDHGEKSIFGIQCPVMKFLELATVWL